MFTVPIISKLPLVNSLQLKVIAGACLTVNVRLAQSDIALYESFALHFTVWVPILYVFADGSATISSIKH